MKDLSILVASVSSRRNTFLSKSLEMLYGQLESLDKEDQDRVEIIYLIDNKTLFLGEKRNYLVDLSNGRYVTQVDDDDRISEDYIISLLKAIDTTKGDVDVITFNASVSIDSEKPKICRYSKEYKKDYNTENEYYRIPNHLCCVKRDLALKVNFPNKIYGEDSAYSAALLPLLKTEYSIDSVLYYYDYNSLTTETQQELSKPPKQIREHKVDVILLSNAKTPQLRQITQNAIDSCLENAGGVTIKVTIMEENPNVFYRNARVIQPIKGEEFNYNRRMNQAANKTQSEWIFFGNNDLIFQTGWIEELLKVNHPIMSPKEPKDIRQKDVLKNEKGYITGTHFSGWGFLMKRLLWEEIGGLDEDFSFFYADNSVVHQLEALGIEPMLVTSSVVEHLGSTTLKTETQDQQNELMWSQTEKFNKKYNQSLFEDNKYYKIWKMGK